MTKKVKKSIPLNEKVEKSQSKTIEKKIKNVFKEKKVFKKSIETDLLLRKSEDVDKQKAVKEPVANEINEEVSTPAVVKTLNNSVSQMESSGDSDSDIDLDPKEALKAFVENVPVDDVASDSSDESDEETSQKRAKKVYDEENNEKTIFVGNLPTSTKESQLRQLFNNYGNILTVRFRLPHGKIIWKNSEKTKQSSMNAYVVFSEVTNALKSVELNGLEFKGKIIRVNMATAKPQEAFDTKRTIFVGNLKSTVLDEDLYAVFGNCGEIDYVRRITNEKGCKGIAYVCFKDKDSVVLAMELNETLIKNRPVRVQRCNRTKQKTPEEKKKMFAANLAEKKRGKKIKEQQQRGADDKRQKRNKVKSKREYQGLKISGDTKMIHKTNRNICKKIKNPKVGNRISKKLKAKKLKKNNKNIYKKKLNTKINKNSKNFIH